MCVYSGFQYRGDIDAEHYYRRRGGPVFLNLTLFDNIQALESYGDTVIWTLLLPLLIQTVALSA